MSYFGNSLERYEHFLKSHDDIWIFHSSCSVLLFSWEKKSEKAYNKINAPEK